MKLKYFITSLLAVFALTLVSCSDDNNPTLLDEVKVSSSYVAIDMAGGSTSITLTATDSWAFDISGIPEWLTVTPTNGAAGQNTITFSADETLDGRTCELKVACAGKVQRINVIQGLSVVSDATCAEVIAGPDSKTYRVTGTVLDIYNTVYGNWHLGDDTGVITIYGTLDAKGQTKNFLSLGIEVGDIVTVEGPKTTYGTTVELVDVTVVKIQKSLIKVESADPDDFAFPLEGGDVTVTLTNKGDGLNIEIPDDAKDWLSIASIGGTTESPVVKFHAPANAGGDRSAKVVFKTFSGGKEYTNEATFTQKGSIVAATVAQFIAAPTGNTQYRLTGVIQKVEKADYGNVYLRDYSGEVYVYGIGSKGDFAALGLKEGDIVTLVGKRGEYNGTAQMTGGTYESHKPVTRVSIEEFLDKEDNADVYYMLTANIDQIDNPTYGNLYLNDGNDRVYCYGCYPGYGALNDDRKNWLATAGIEVGDKLSIIGVKSTYNGVPQLANGFYFSHEKPSAGAARRVRK